MAIQSLFGPTPAQIQEMRRQQQEQEILASGREFGVFAPLYQAGLRFGAQGRRATASLLGNQDPMLQKATGIQSVLAKYQGQDINSPEVMQSIASDLRSIDPEASLRAAQMARTLAPKRDIRTADGAIVDVTDPMSPQVLYQAEKPTKELSPSDQAKQIIFSLSEKPQRTSEEEIQLRAAQNVLEASRPKTVNNILSPGTKNVLEIDKKQAEDYLAVQNSALKSLGVLQRMKDIARQGVVTGSLAEERTAFLTALDSIGLSTSNARKVLGNTEQFQKETEALVQQILKIYGYNPSNIDVQRAVKSVPSIVNSAGGLTKLLDNLINVKQQEYAESTRALDFFRDKEGSFKGFKPTIPITAPKQTGIQGLSDEELLRIINKGAK
jgi:hypothetical protein